MAVVQGFDEVLKNLNREIKAIEHRSLAGLKAAGLKVQREAQKRVPVEHGDLKRSAFTNTVSDSPPSVEVGFSAVYAIFVHENMEQRLKGKPRPSGLGSYWNPGGPKFLESAVRDLAKDIVETVRKYARVK